jgi:aldehyde:ferredoxin oxidoreductase
LWGGQCDVRNFPAAWKCRELSQRYGFDQASPIAFALELYQRGILTKEDTDGLELDWGNEAAVIELIRKIAFREGIGDILAEGSERAARKIGKGAEKYVLTVKGLELYRSEPRTDTTVKHMSIAVNPRGGDDAISSLNCPETFAETYSDEYLGELVPYLDMFDDVKKEIYGEQPSVASFDASGLEGKAKVVKWYEELTCIADSLGICTNAGTGSGATGPTYYAKLYSACTGWAITPQEIMRVGERIYNLMRAYIVREGLTRKDDDYPARFYNEPIPDGPTKGASLSRDTVAKELDAYYEVVGWDKETGIPTKGKLRELDLGYVADELIKTVIIGNPPS